MQAPRQAQSWAPEPEGSGSRGLWLAVLGGPNFMPRKGSSETGKPLTRTTHLPTGWAGASQDPTRGPREGEALWERGF